MNEKEQLEWCTREHATVWFGEDSVKLKVKGLTGAVNGKTLEAAISNTERIRKEKKDLTERSKDL
jgi:hypothetical protein